MFADEPFSDRYDDTVYLVNVYNENVNLINSTDELTNLTNCLLQSYQPDLFKLCFSAFSDSTLLPSFIASLNLNYIKSSDTLRPFVPSLGLQFFWTVIFSLNVISSIIGNLIVILIICGYKQMRTKTNLFLLNLSVADLMMATFNTMFNFIFMLKSHWPFGTTYCIINNFLSSVATSSSVFTITVTCFDSYAIYCYRNRVRQFIR
uniref:G-protein coupled receptors family 1 profile domain-containing protein n=1 Tax=Tetranychus urticae TaxID=32264 RepID=T1K7I0_TETUR